ncbi:MAG: hypothetical protein AAGM22_07850 [Acidobacteriota bacterium]
MTPSNERPEGFDIGHRPELFQNPAIFLSASVPYDKKPRKEGFTDRQYLDWIASCDGDLVRDLVSDLCQFAFSRNLGLIFGGDPAVTETVLESAQHFGNTEPDRVLVFQSLQFWDVIPKETFELEQGKLGTPIWTAQKESKDASLTHMRRAMIGSPNLVAAVFAGGMDGLFEEEALCRELQPDVPCFAVGSTGGAAKDLLATGRCHGERADRRTLDESTSYPRVLGRIFDDLKGRLTD